MLNPLVEEAEKLGGRQRWQVQGMLPVEKVSTSGKWAGCRVVVYLQFYSPEELTQLVAWAAANDYKPYSPDVFTGADPGMKSLVSGDVPLCPAHHTPMKKSTKDGGWFCPKRVQGGYCSERA